jgi:hypothetical protein
MSSRHEDRAPPEDNGMGYFAELKKHFLIKGSGWDRKVHNISDSGKEAQGYQPSRCQLLL